MNFEKTHYISGVYLLEYTVMLFQISTTGVSKQKLKNQNSDSGYAGAFIKSRSTLQKKAVSDDEENEIISFSASKNMTDDELLLACGGRTAHK